MGSIQPPSSVSTESVDVLVVGAGVSGINAGYRIQTELPHFTYKIVESRGAIGGTWDLFRYPGIRSDSDLHTFGFPWRLWAHSKSIVDGTSIRNYIRESAEEFGIDKKIEFKHKVLSSDWSSQEQNWNVIVDNEGTEKRYKARFLLFSTGYYDYDTPLQTQIPGLDNFQGQRIHPQFWPEDLDYTNKNVVIIGSGATAVTLLPNMTDKAAKVTMLQRSPTYIIPQPAKDPLGSIWHRTLPTWLSSRLTRWKFLILPLIFFHFCRTFPNAARGAIRLVTKRQLKGSHLPQDPHFQPTYNPWEQRLCVTPDADFFQAIRAGKGTVVTDTIKLVKKDGIQTTAGTWIPADIIVTATGLKVHLAGGSRIAVDGQPFSFYEQFQWRGALMSRLPNAAFVLGYTNASWTLGADCTALLFTRIMKYMEAQGYASITPTLTPEDLEGPAALKPSSPMNLNSTYLEKAKGLLPSAGDRGPWKVRKNYILDRWAAVHCDVTEGTVFRRGETKKVA
ncbi:putative flavin-binding monooxygenase [Pseudovirgaria hyperparasitica]|uniref:Flavin-binding monooxygenase n=1 Tax=Pseudovirgaria hyperparasitica TaxID=470096 RepID=A0A6A6WFQ2_9PEZI|nr:putative flavin-binding monooxygenase [Pseudovirgaria hyperparasitica]KAF2761652.1 putative flavin-binding monooxygenase [Pseudovirgaria hyperparasitica]